MTDRNVSTEDLDATFEVLADATRLDLLQALWESEEQSLSFSSLRERTDVADSGRFNYHLDKLTPQFVRRDDGEYELTHAGTRVVGAAVSGAFGDDDVTTDPVTVGTCQHCGGTLRGTYGSGTVRIDCADCEAKGDRLSVPPVVAAGHDPDELPGVFGRRVLTDAQAMNRGFCPVCTGRVDGSVTRFSDHDRVIPEEIVEVAYQCRECGHRHQSSALVPALDHPAVLGFLYDAGVDLRETPLYAVDGLDATRATVTSEDPVRVTVPVECGDECLRVTLDDSLDVVDVERP